MEKKQTVLMIIGLGHSGSTMLSALLSRYNSVTSLGEVYCALGTKESITTNRDPERPCTCGQPVGRCPVWGAYLNDSRIDTGTFVDRYKVLLETPELEKYQVVVDSSKNVHLTVDVKELITSKEINCHVVFLLKDVRSWVASMNKLSHKKSYIPFFSELSSAISWYRMNRKILYDLTKLQLPYSQISYEQLCSDPEHYCKKILQEATAQDFTLRPNETTHAHITYGNAVRYDMKRILQVTYDTRHLQQFWTGVIALPFFQWNKKMVYRED